MAAMQKLHNFLWAQELKIEVRNNMQVILLKFKMANFLNICDCKNYNLIYCGG